MATFQVQVEGLTSLSIGTTPTLGELTEFLKDGVNDVTNRWLAVRAQDVEAFQRESSIIDSNSGLYIGGAKIISVIREAGADGSSDNSTAWEVCRKVPASMQSKVVNTESLHFASKYNPVYIIDDNGRVNVYPAASANNGYKVFYVNNVPTDETNSASLTYAHSDIKYFPLDKFYLVVLYASMRTLQAAMGATTISDLSVTAVPPDTPTLTSITFSSIGAVDATLVAAATSTTLGGTDTAPSYDTSVATSALAEANDFIDSEEDVELANAKLGEVQALMQDELNEFNQENIAFQAGIKEALSEFQSANQIAIGNAERSQNRQLQNSINAMQAIFQDNQSLINKYQSELAVYQAEVGSQVQEYTQNLQADGTGYQWLQEQYIRLKAEYDAAFMIAAPKQQPKQQVRA